MADVEVSGLAMAINAVRMDVQPFTLDKRRLFVRSNDFQIPSLRPVSKISRISGCENCLHPLSHALQQSFDVVGLYQNSARFFDRPGKIFDSEHVLENATVLPKLPDPSFVVDTVCTEMVVYRLTAHRAADFRIT